MNNTKRKDFELMRILKVTEVNRYICDTNMGVLKLQLRKGEKDYRFLLDAVPLPKDLNKEVYELLYKPEIPQVQVFGPSVEDNEGVNVVIDPPNKKNVKIHRNKKEKTV